MRIVSLVPSITELLWDLGLGAALVGRTGFCIHPREALRGVAKVGGTKDVKLDRLRALAPTHVIVNIDENPRAVAEALAGFVPHVIVTHPCRPEDNRHLYRLLGHVFGREADADRLVARFDAALEAARGVAAARPAERVLYLIWRDPWMTIAPSTYVSATLATVGWQSLPPDPATRYPAFETNADWLDDVDRVLLSSEPYRFGDKHLAEVAAWAQRPVHLIDGEWASWYGSRAITGQQALAAFRRALDQA
ncbi:ABC transporter substrate-binding protein [Nitrogeniibacter mangrovi]|uniref:ABC transporter substrate-binding protein n=1 Tax=Nitrogeniibacter mangrovi TaxID=2016596 RepID=A0A6C1BBA6_9RHOO|nr:helical backbone metal receptor [Nitrogeniibacter mangrovi]QID19690.1 ABC transporter substrate-binding protein [Nitrogeniibacter mangrovi]